MAQLTPDNILLGLILVRPAHGYELLEHFRDPACLGEVWNLSTSQLYAVLKRLENLGFITGCQRDSVDAPARIEYTVTESGRKQFWGWLHEKHPSPSIRRVRLEFLSRLYLAQHLGLSVAPFVERQKTACEEYRAGLVAEQRHLGEGVGWLRQKLVISQVDAILQWLGQINDPF